jgi:uncharacterized ion transporter superfamily protein YfcC
MSYIIITAVFALIFALRNANQFKEQSNRISQKMADSKDQYSFHFKEVADKANKRWHEYQALLQIMFVFVLVDFDRSPDGFLWIPAVISCFSIFWIVFDIVLNVYGLNRPWDYVGTTAALDRLFQKFRNPETVMFLTKMLFFTLSTLAWMILSYI